MFGDPLTIGSQAYVRNAGERAQQVERIKNVQSTGVPGRNLVTHAATQPTAPRIAMP
jgi:hypothetical protein